MYKDLFNPVGVDITMNFSSQGFTLGYYPAVAGFDPFGIGNAYNAKE